MISALLCSLLAAAPESVVVRGARVFDGSQSRGGLDVWVSEGKIKAVGPGLKVPAEVRAVDGSGGTLLPGFIDAHTHSWGEALKQALVFGVTTELDMFSDVKFDAEARKREASGNNHDAADLRSSGTLVTVAKGHGTEYGLPIPVLAKAADAQAFVDARIAEGSDYIKIIYDDGSAYGHSIPTLSKDEMAAVVRAAHARHKLAVVHIGSESGAMDAIQSGADGLAHIFEDKAPSAAFVALAKKHRVFVIATLTVNESVAGTASGASLAADARLLPYLDAQAVTNLKKGFSRRAKEVTDFANALAAVAALQKAGVPVLAGTDAPNPGTTHGASIHRELELLVKAGLTPAQALAAATSVPARLFGLPDRGRIAPGLRADLVLVKGDPASDILATRDIVSIWKAGFPVDREPMKAAVAKEKQDDEAARKGLPEGFGTGFVSDFEDGSLKSAFGSGFAVSTDSIVGGKSSADLKVVDGGANGSKRALQISGTISDALPYAWAGAMFSPGGAPMAPANLSSKKALHFWAKGEGKTYRVQLFTKSGGFQPAMKTFTAGPSWAEVVFPFSDFGGSDGHDVNGILFTPGSDAGAFTLSIDEVKLE